MYRIQSMVGIVTILMLLLAMIASCSEGAATTTAPVPVAPPADLRLELVLSSVNGWLEAPTNLVQAPGGPSGDNRTGRENLVFRQRTSGGRAHLSSGTSSHS